MRKFVLFILTLLLILPLGCQADNKAPANEAAPPTKKIKKEQRVPQTAPEPKRSASPNERAHRLAKLATRLPEVNDATVVIFGKYAIVGIDVNATLDRSRVGVIKYSVAESLKEDPLGASSLVTADPDLVQRLREINQDLKKGKPLKGFFEELSDITGRIIPLAPKEVKKKENPPSKQNQKDLNQTNNPKSPRKSLFQK